ncbi:hypothetical protein V6Z11_D03G074600 [Gossypium hirsutum]
MEARLSASLGLPSFDLNHPPVNTDFGSLYSHFITLTSSPKNPQKPLKPLLHHLSFASTSISGDPQPAKPTKFRIPLPFSNLTESQQPKSPKFPKLIEPRSRNSSKAQILMKNLSVLERALIGAGGGGIAGAFTYVCLLPFDTIKTKMQTKGASEIYANTFDAVVKTFQTNGILGFYRGVSAVIIGSTASSAVYFGTCEFAIMVPKELITQRMQAGAKGRSWEVLLRILEKDGILGLYAGYSATLLRNLPAGVLSYSSFEYLKAAVLRKTKQTNLEPIQSVCCGALAGAISASLTTPLDVVKTRLMTQVHGNKVAAAMYGGVNATVKQILKEEGWIGLTSGLGPRVVHSACFSALGYFAFETARLAILHQYLKHKEKELSKISVAPA